MKPGEQERAVARLWVNLQGPAKEVVRMCKPQDFEDARGVERLLRILRESPLASMPVPDAYKKKQAYDQIRRRPSIGDYIVREQRAFREMTEALRRVRNSRDEKSGARRHDHRATSGNSSVCSEAEYEMVEDEALWQQEQIGSGIPSSPKCTSLSRRATDGLGWNKKRHGVHSNRDTVA